LDIAIQHTFNGDATKGTFITKNDNAKAAGHFAALAYHLSVGVIGACP